MDATCPARLAAAATAASRREASLGGGSPCARAAGVARAACSVASSRVNAPEKTKSTWRVRTTLGGFGLDVGWSGGWRGEPLPTLRGLLPSGGRGGPCGESGTSEG